jgi:hypothetical protein
MIKKTLLPTNDLYIQFTDEEIQQFGWEAGQKLDVKQHADGSIEVRPYVKMELDMEDWPKELLLMLIKDSIEQDISVNDVISNLLKKSLENFSDQEDLTQDKKELLLEKLDKGSVSPDTINNDTSICANDI